MVEVSGGPHMIGLHHKENACSLPYPFIDWRQNLKRALETTLEGTEC